MIIERGTRGDRIYTETRLVKCSFCGARKGKSCKTKNGKKYLNNQPHRARWLKARTRVFAREGIER